MKKSIYILLLFFGIITISSFSFETFIKENSTINLITTKKIFKAGTYIKLIFSSQENTKKPLLILNYSYGNTFIEAEKKNDLFIFTIPLIISKKTGIIDWKLLQGGTIILKNKIEIVPNTSTNTLIETYLGPISIQAGPRDYSMLVAIPTDMFDNPLPKNTSVKIHEQFLENISYSNVKTDNLISWYNIMAKNLKGEISVSVSCNNTNSSELITVIHPSNPENFIINIYRNHDYADGNQLTELTTSIIKDEFGNTVSDGSLVEFIITNNKNNVLKTSGSTLNGIAKAKILHPNNEDSWKIKAYLNGLAESNTITINYKPIRTNLKVTFKEDNRKIIVGPLLSFMNQLIPDGANVKLKIIHKNILIETKSTTSFKGYATFNLAKDFYKENTYNFIIEALGNSKIIETKQYAK